MKRKPISVDRLARLANLKIGSGNQKKISSQLEKTIDYFDVVRLIPNLDQEVPTSQVTNNTNVVAQDKVGPSLPREKILNSKKKYFISNK